ncbi:unnamed protein product [Adineta steineri]|uniref:Uncharacterized protein n=1 Tax=Adineta steineri TaxID=433720 RepID=A0A815E9R2_9BILA|nr:unnamed protein product [Adineta steineri]CAF3640352.1 unnamed protein product [Adineta steineri]
MTDDDDDDDHALKCTTEQILIKRLLQYYEPSVRPVINAQAVVTISFRMEITQLFELEEKTQILTTNVRIEQKWIDENLGWNQSEYVGIRGIRLPSHRIWLPDSYIYNSAFDLSSDSPTQGVVNGPYVMVYHTGEVVFPVLMKLRTTCKVNIQYFPFDRQVCGLKFASWIYDISSINYELVSSTSEQQQSESIRNSGWAILDVKQGLVWRSKNNKTYGELVYGVHISRRPLYYVFNVIIPCAMLSCLTCMSFWLPTSSGEKVTLGLTCFVAFSVFMLMVAEKVPATSDTVPIIGIYLTIVMSLTSISVIMAVIVANLYQQATMCTTEKHRAPRWLTKLALTYLPPILRMQDKVKTVLSQKLKMHANMKITRNSSWEHWGLHGFLFGIILSFVGILTQILEFPRVYNGAINVDVTTNVTGDLYTISNYYQHFWPWTYPASLFGLFTFLTGVIGVLAGIRRTYSSIYGLFTMSVVSALFAIYLIVYFSFIISFYRTLHMDSPKNRSQPETVSYALASTQLTVAILNVITSILSAIFAGRAIALCVNKGVKSDDVYMNMATPGPQRPEDSTASHGLSCEPTPLPLATNKNEVDVNYENMIENLLLQQVLLYTHDHQNPSHYSRVQHTRSTTTATSSLLIRQQTRYPYNHNDEHLVLTSSKQRNNHDEEATICVVESNQETSSSLIENILYHYNQRNDPSTRFDQNLLDLLVKRNRDKQKSSTSSNTGYYFRLQWLAIGLIIDRLFFYLYFTATVVSYFVTLWLIPYSHPNLTIDIQNL